jgi:hypothetical protein
MVRAACIQGSSRKSRDLPFGGRARRSPKTFLAVRKGCNITWGYVASIEWMGGAGSVTSFFSLRRFGKCLKISEQVYRIG